jgi:transposase-like protein
VLTDTGRLELEVPRDRLSTFDPQLIAKYQRRFPGFDEKIVSTYARGMSRARSRGVAEGVAPSFVRAEPLGRAAFRTDQLAAR